MGEAKMVAVKVKIVRYLSDDPQPGVVECELEDVHGQKWSIVEKTAIVSTAHLDARSSYPQQGLIGCEIVQRRRDADREIVRISTERPWMEESTDGSTEFDVGPEALVNIG
jgi:hypothetical protein